MFAFGGLNVVLFWNVKTLELSATAAAGTACARNTTFAKRPTFEREDDDRDPVSAQAVHEQRERQERRGNGEPDVPDAHGRLRFHQRAPNGSAGARSRRRAAPSGTIVATVSCDAWAPPAYGAAPWQSVRGPV